MVLAFHGVFGHENVWTMTTLTYWLTTIAQLLIIKKIGGRKTRSTFTNRKPKPLHMSTCLFAVAELVRTHLCLSK